MSLLPAVVVTFVMVITKVPGNVGVHPGGAAAVGVMSEVMAWGTGLASTAAAKAARASVYFILKLVK